MADLWWVRVRAKLSEETVSLIEDFITNGLLKEKLSPKRLAQLAFSTDFKDDATLNLDWEWLCQYYMIRFSASRTLEKLQPHDYVVGNSLDGACEVCSEKINLRIYQVMDVPTLPACDFCRCGWSEWLPELFYIKNGRTEFAIDETSEKERVEWIVANRHIFKGKYETPRSF